LEQSLPLPLSLVCLCPQPALSSLQLLKAEAVAVNNFPIRCPPSVCPSPFARLFGIVANDLNALIYAGFSTFIIKDSSRQQTTKDRRQTTPDIRDQAYKYDLSLCILSIIIYQYLYLLSKVHRQQYLKVYLSIFI